MTDYLETVSAYVADTTLNDLPQPAIDRARRVLADSVAAIAAGSAEPEVVSLTERVTGDGTTGRASVIGTGLATEPAKAAFLNGTAGTFLELDEGNQFSRGHPGIHALPSALAVSEAAGKSGGEFLTAMILGYEIGARIGMASKILPSMHPHGTWGTVGSAVAVAKLHGADAGQVKEVINVSSTLGLATSRQTMLQGGTVRNSFAGVSGHFGILAWQMVESGFTGERDGLTTVWGTVSSTDWQPDVLTHELGERYEIARNYFKRHACCRYNHGALDAFQMIVDARGTLDPATVAHVKVETYSLAAQLSDRTPRNTLAGKFSLPFAMASTLINGSSGVESFTWDKIRDQAIQAFADKVEVVEDPSLTAMMPQYRPARVTVTFTDGTTASAETKTNRGDTEDPYSDAELDAKYADLAGRVWSPETASAVYDACFRVESLANIGALTGLFTGPVTAPTAAQA
ncbi:MAG: MmgE/PrpD family protein [Alphaproteobacteria bacterium]|nr:MmgE/PrpD family protein [Alphaproteobacteria bacterium]